MKKSILFGLLAATLVLSSCDKVKETIEDINEVKEPTYVDNGLSITVNYKEGGFETTWEAKFKVDQAKADTVCTSYSLTERFSLETLAKAAYNELMEEADSTDVIKYDGSKTITAEYASWVGDSKKIVAPAMKTIYNSFVRKYEEYKKYRN